MLHQLRGHRPLSGMEEILERAHRVLRPLAGRPGIFGASTARKKRYRSASSAKNTAAKTDQPAALGNMPAQTSAGSRTPASNAPKIRPTPTARKGPARMRAVLSAGDA